MNDKSLKLVYPDSLTRFWNHAHKLDVDDENPMSDAEFEFVWIAIRDIVFDQMCKQIDKGRIERTTPEDLSNDFLVYLLGDERNPCLNEIYNESGLRNLAKKYVAQKWNKTGWEINSVLRESIAKMVAEGELCRDGYMEDQKGYKYIRSATRVWLPMESNPTLATHSQCCAACKTLQDGFFAVGRVKITQKMEDEKGSRLLTPAEARSAVLKLLTCLGGNFAMEFSMLNECIRNLTRNAISPYLADYDAIIADCSGGDDDESPDSALVGKEFEGESFGNSHKRVEYLVEDEEWRRRQIESLAEEAAKRVLRKIEEGGDIRVFYDYTLPKKCGLKVRMGDLGPTSSIDYSHKKNMDILSDELHRIQKRSELYEVSGISLVKRIIQIIIDNDSEKLPDTDLNAIKEDN